MGIYLQVEFQARGSPHVHGTLWIDWKAMAKQNGNFKTNLIKASFDKIKNENTLTCDEEDALTSFIDKNITCDIYNPLTEELVKKVNMHRHSVSCRKHGHSCRFNFPRYPSLKTIISIPARVIERDVDKRKQLLKENHVILDKVKATLTNVDIMKSINNIDEKDLTNCYLYKKTVHKLSLLLNENLEKNFLEKKDFSPLRSSIKWNSDKLSLTRPELESLCNQETEHLKNVIKLIDSIVRKRLLAVLKYSNISDETSDENLIKIYENALKINEKGYSVILKRKTNEIFINNYNNEWINAWSANMDLQLSLDYYSVITYISEYYRYVLILMKFALPIQFSNCTL